MTYTINGKPWTELDINRRCAELMVVEVKISIDQKHWLLPSSIKNNGGYNPYNPCTNPADTDAIIDKCLNSLLEVHHTELCDYTKWEDIMDRGKCTKLIAACICFIEINEGKL
tara:strand:+ start:162 stop:500 length:339 start_codon:yes stop_codon:yes gene_type:complete